MPWNSGNESISRGLNTQNQKQNTLKPSVTKLSTIGGWRSRRFENEMTEKEGVWQKMSAVRELKYWRTENAALHQRVEDLQEELVEASLLRMRLGEKFEKLEEGQDQKIWDDVFRMTVLGSGVPKAKNMANAAVKARRESFTDDGPGKGTQ
jgi:hypothetical protein